MSRRGIRSASLVSRAQLPKDGQHVATLPKYLGSTSTVLGTVL